MRRGRFALPYGRAGQKGWRNVSIAPPQGAERRGASAVGARMLLGLLLLTAVLSNAPAALATEHDLCTDAGTIAAAPLVEHLRSYRAAFSGPVRLALDRQDRIYIADPAKNRIAVRAADGRLIEDRSGMGYPVALAVDDEPSRPFRLYVGDGRQGSVTAYGADWSPVLQLGQGPGEFQQPADLAVDPATGRIFVADSAGHDVSVYGVDGTLLFGFGARGDQPDQFQFPVGLYLDTVAQELLVADQLNFRLQIFDLAGNFICRLGDAAGSNPGSIFGLRARLFNMAQSPWVDPDGRLYIPDSTEGRVRVADRLGQVLGDVGSFGRGTAALLLPSDVAIDSHGRLFVAATNTARVEMFGLDAYSDPEAFAPAQVEISPATFDHRNPPAHVTALIEVPGYRLGDVDISTLTANGVLGDPATATLGDADGDFEPDIMIAFDAAGFADTLPASGVVRVSVRGAMSTLALDGWNEIAVAGGAVDQDGDGVLDGSDLCPDTAADAVVDEGGCSIDQHCPCAAPAAGETWAGHGAYVTCISDAARSFSDAGLIGQAEIGVFVRGAARSDCGGSG